MSAVPMLASQPWVERLGWTLVHFLWQGFAIALLYGAVRESAARRWRPHARYLLACAALAGMMAAPPVTWELVRPTDGSRRGAKAMPSIPRETSTTGTGATLTANLPDSIRAVAFGAQPAQLLNWVVMAWLAGAVVFWVRLAGGWVVAARMRSVAVRRAPPEWQEALGQLGARIGLTGRVRLLVSALVQTPTVLGFLRPVVLVPVGALGGLPVEYLEALLLHELAHIRRHDYLINMLQGVAEALLFYHPAVWWVSGHIRAEREMCCDDMAVSASGDALTYARALTRLESSRPAHAAAIAANGGSLAGRIARLLGRPRPAVRTGLGPGVLAAAILLMAAAYGLFGQAGAPAAFQTVSIRRNTSDWNERFRHSMGMGVNSSLKLMVQFAYAPHDSPHWLPLPASQVVGGPAWIDSEGYDIEAKPATNSDPKQIWLMWQTLLADRFRLRLHRETRELPVYHLTVAPGGPKLPTAKEAACISFPPGTPPRHVPGKVDCGYVSGPHAGYTAGLLHMNGRKVHMSDLIPELALILDRPVWDETGYRGEFDLDLSFAADEALRGFPAAGAGGPGGPNIIAAMEEQLGLKLVPGKGPVEVLVIDHAERPAGK